MNEHLGFCGQIVNVSLSILPTTSLTFPKKACGSGWGGGGKMMGILGLTAATGTLAANTVQAWPWLLGFGRCECCESGPQPDPHPRQGCATSLSCCFTSSTRLLARGKKTQTPKHACGSYWPRLAEQLRFWGGSEDTKLIFFFFFSFGLVISSTTKLCGWQTHSPCCIGYCRLCNKKQTNKQTKNQKNPTKQKQTNKQKHTQKNQNRDLGYSWRKKNLMWALACDNLASSCVWVTKAKLPCVCYVLSKLRPHFPLQHFHLHG